MKFTRIITLLLTAAFFLAQNQKVGLAQPAPSSRLAILGTSTPRDFDVPSLTNGSTVYLPVVMNLKPRIPSVFGAESIGLAPWALTGAREANLYFVRNNVFSWEDIEPTAPDPVNGPTYNWSAVDETALIQAASLGLKMIATIKYTPGWAQKYAGISCGPMKLEYLDEFAQFVGAAVAKYSVPPYNVKYWEIWNEPDTPRDLAWPDRPFGCWGEPTNDYYGGVYYADMLKFVYPAIKTADPEATVLNGGLLLDCEPEETCDDDNVGRFFRGMLLNQAGSYLDVVSFHGYGVYMDNGYVLDELNPKWYHRGGAVLGKADFLRDEMAAFNGGVIKPLMITEAALICPNDIEGFEWCKPPNSVFYETQADYFIKLYTKIWEDGFQGGIWYSIENAWRYSSLFDASQDPKPVYDAAQFMAAELEGATVTGKINPESNVEGFVFQKNGLNIWVVWSTDGNEHSVTVPGGTTNVYNKYGGSIVPVGGEVPVNSPVYIEWSP